MEGGAPRYGGAATRPCVAGEGVGGACMEVGLPDIEGLPPDPVWLVRGLEVSAWYLCIQLL